MVPPHRARQRWWEKFLLNLQTLDQQFQLITALTRPGNLGKGPSALGWYPQPREEKQKDPRVPSLPKWQRHSPGRPGEPCAPQLGDSICPLSLSPIWMFPNSPGQRLGLPTETRSSQGLGPCSSLTGAPQGQTPHLPVSPHNPKPWATETKGQ